jgi:sirohydrochlorin ferrochelatase
VNGLLLVGHGSRSPQSVEEMEALSRLVAGGLPPDVAVRLGYLEMTDPPAGRVLDDLVARGCDQIVVLPLMLLGAGHTKSDLPAVVLEGRHRHPGVELRLGSPLGIAHGLVQLLGESVVEAGGAQLPLLLLARGTSDPDANGDAAKAARLVAEWTHAPFVHTGFSGVTGPLVPEALDVFARLGHTRMAVAFWFLCFGTLVDRARRDIAAFTARTGVEVVDAGYLGADRRVAELVVDGYLAALTAGPSPAVNCDLCAYRAPWPGLEDRVAQPIGVGHSHLAAEHRH